jgi:hypothetical protein
VCSLDGVSHALELRPVVDFLDVVPLLKDVERAL